MNDHDKKKRKLNGSITKSVIELHAKGYHLDFLIIGDRQLVCVQNNQHFPVGAVHINVVDQAYDQLSRSFKYIHTIDTGHDDRGVLITDALFTNQRPA